MRNQGFIEELLADIGVVAHNDFFKFKPERLDVSKIMVFTNLLGSINREIQTCIDGISFNILVVEDLSVSLEKDIKQNLGSESSNAQNDEDDTDSKSKSSGGW